MPTLSIALAQINPTIGDIDGNLSLMVDAARRAQAEGARLVAFPELSLTAYYPADLLEDPDFQRRLAKGIEDLIAATRELPDLHWVVGAPTPNTGIGKPLFNSLLVLKNGEILLRYHKQLLPTYNIFDERRHFEPGPDVARILDIEDVRVGFMICEDGWNDEGRDYIVNPFNRLADAAPDLVVSINASPSSIGRREMRHEIFSKASARHRLPLVYVNQVGGHDQLIYDGSSFAVDPVRGIVMEGARFQPDLMVLQVHTRGSFLARDGKELSAVDAKGLSTNEFYRQQLVLGLRDYARRCGFSTAVVGSSGGIDSALTLAIAAEALGPKNVVAITMPSQYSSTGSVTDSERLCQNLGIALYTHPIKELVELYAAQFHTAFGEALTGLSKENLQARIRGTILMEYSNRFGHLLLTTGNKSEISVGYCTLYGDTNGGLGVIGDLYKTEVFSLARHYNEVAGREVIPVAIIDKPPSAELAPGQKDTDSLPPYEVLDPILKTLIEGSRLSEKEGEAAMKAMLETGSTSEGKATIERVKRMIARNEYKRRQSPPILRVRSRAFGSGRQMPIAAKY
ncbi:MAG TPA: NAD+ synthase [Steroidobacter sp.]|uniref:NAD+ synthase n=1 Tax=Steroidobacter sp. TaxID=1978227 RepID=UPI002ED86590